MTSQAEDELASFLKKVAKIGCGKTKWEVLLIVQKTLEQKGNKPEKFNGERWYHRFMQSHPKLVSKFCRFLIVCTIHCTKPRKVEFLLWSPGEDAKRGVILSITWMKVACRLTIKQLKRIAPKGSKEVHGQASGKKLK